VVRLPGEFGTEYYLGVLLVTKSGRRRAGRVTSVALVTGCARIGTSAGRLLSPSRRVMTDPCAWPREFVTILDT